MKMLKPTSRARTLLALIVSLLPSNGLRILFYRALFGYRFGAGSGVGFGTLITCATFTCGARTFIGRDNRFIGPFKVEIGDKVIIGRFNRFTAGAMAADPSKAKMNYALHLRVGDGVLINDSHYFDVYGRISIGDGTWVAGAGSQFWTHGASVLDRDIDIGARCYLGSAVRFAPGAGIADDCILGLGSVVVSRLTETSRVVAGFPAKPLRPIDASDDRQFVFEMQ
ncbi:hypothetical protein BH10PSE4_BH10PSE4_07110 [soil metagenome]